ncbi:hypothetical protein FAGKG844_690007 [Frankia sp. AgKG'84/4]
MGPIELDLPYYPLSGSGGTLPVKKGMSGSKNLGETFGGRLRLGTRNHNLEIAAIPDHLGWCGGDDVAGVPPGRDADAKCVAASENTVDSRRF